MQRNSIRFTSVPPDEERRYFLNKQTARPRAGEQQRNRQMDMEDVSFEDNFVDPHRFRDAEYKQKARFRATKQEQSILYITRIKMIIVTTITIHISLIADLDLCQTETHTKRVWSLVLEDSGNKKGKTDIFLTTKKEKTDIFKTKMKSFSHKEGNSQILNTDEDNKQTDVLSPIEVCFLTTDWSELSHETHTTLINFIMTLIRREHKNE